MMYKNNMNVFGIGVKKEGKYMEAIIFRVVPVDLLQMFTNENVCDLAVAAEGEVRLSGYL